MAKHERSYISAYAIVQDILVSTLNLKPENLSADALKSLFKYCRNIIKDFNINEVHFKEQDGNLYIAVEWEIDVASTVFSGLIYNPTEKTIIYSFPYEERNYLKVAITGRTPAPVAAPSFTQPMIPPGLMAAIKPTI